MFKWKYVWQHGMYNDIKHIIFYKHEGNVSSLKLYPLKIIILKQKYFALSRLNCKFQK